MSEWRKPRLSPKERAEQTIERVLAALTSAGSEPGKSVGPFESNRAMRRGGPGQPSNRIFSETMKIPKEKR